MYELQVYKAFNAIFGLAYILQIQFDIFDLKQQKIDININIYVFQLILLLQNPLKYERKFSVVNKVGNVGHGRMVSEKYRPH